MANLKHIERTEQEEAAQIHLEVDLPTYSLLNGLIAALEAASAGEVIRRALQLHDVFDPILDATVESDATTPRTRRNGSVTKAIHVRIPMRTKERLDQAKREINGSYSDVVSRSLLLMAQLIRERDVIRKEIQNDEVEFSHNVEQTAVADGGAEPGAKRRELDLPLWIEANLA